MRRTALMFALAGLVGALVATPVAVYASHQFTDVSDFHLFHNSIDWMADNGITVGCNPPANTNYCPEDNVTRGQMAAFMKRLAEKKVVDAATAVNADNASHADTATVADDSGMLEGYTAAELAPRAVFNSTNNAPDGADFTLSVEITAPAPGILILSGAVGAFNASSFDQYHCLLQVDNVTVDGTEFSSLLNGETVSVVNVDEDCSTTGAAEVDAGTYTIDLDVTMVGPQTLLAAVSVWALWVPFDGIGAIPTP